jgi:hypothetical protein
MISRLLNALILITILSGLALGQDPFEIKFKNGFATVKDDGQRKYVEVGWQTTLEKGFNCYILQRSLPDSMLSRDSSSWQDIARIDTISITDTIKTYIYSDYPPMAGEYGYRVKIFLNDTPRVFLEFAVVNMWTLTGVKSLTDQETPLEYECVRNYPNPFNPTTNIVIKLQTGERGSLDIFDLNGRKLESLANGSLPAGIHQYKWDATKYPSGIYFCVLRTQNHTSTAKLVLQK